MVDHERPKTATRQLFSKRHTRSKRARIDNIRGPQCGKFRRDLREFNYQRLRGLKGSSRLAALSRFRGSHFIQRLLNSLLENLRGFFAAAAPIKSATSSIGSLLFSGMAFHALKHRDVAKVDRMFEWFVRLVAGFAFAIRQSAEVNRMLDRNRYGRSRGAR